MEAQWQCVKIRLSASACLIVNKEKRLVAAPAHSAGWWLPDLYLLFLVTRGADGDGERNEIGADREVHVSDSIHSALCFFFFFMPISLQRSL